MKKDSLYKKKSLPEVQHVNTNLEVLNKVKPNILVKLETNFQKIPNYFQIILSLITASLSAVLRA